MNEALWWSSWKSEGELGGCKIERRCSDCGGLFTAYAYWHLTRCDKCRETRRINAHRR